jgi:hypothetical protein
MIENSVKVDKPKGMGSDDPIIQSIDQIMNVQLLSGLNFRGRLIDVKEKSLLFERRDGTRLFVNRDLIAIASEVIDRRRR